MKLLATALMAISINTWAFDVDFNLAKLEEEMAKGYNVSHIYVDDVSPYRLDNLLNLLPIEGQGNTHYQIKYHFEKFGQIITGQCDIIHHKRSKDLFLMPCKYNIPHPLKNIPAIRRSFPAGFWFDYPMLSM